MKKEVVYVSGGNFYDKSRLRDMIKLLDMGYAIRVGINCIGRTRNIIESENYKEALISHYGLKLRFEMFYGCYSYWLTDNENIDSLV